MEIFLIRHTTPAIGKGICYGQSDIDVSSDFSEEIKPILNKVPLRDPRVIYYSSSLIRCTKLASKISPNFTTDERLKELNFGDWEMKKWDNIDQNELNEWMNNFVRKSPPNGESYLDLHKRTKCFLDEILTMNAQISVTVTHAGVIRSINAHIKKISLEKSFNLKINYGGIIKLNL